MYTLLWSFVTVKLFPHILNKVKCFYVTALLNDLETTIILWNLVLSPQVYNLNLFGDSSAVNATGGSSMDWVHLCLLNICWSGMTWIPLFYFWGYLCMQRYWLPSTMMYACHSIAAYNPYVHDADPMPCELTGATVLI